MVLNQFLFLAAALFAIGVYGVLARKNGVMVLMSIELILNAVNLNLVAFGTLRANPDRRGLRAVRHHRRRRRGRRRHRPRADALPQPPEHRHRRAGPDEGLITPQWILVPDLPPRQGLDLPRRHGGVVPPDPVLRQAPAREGAPRPSASAPSASASPCRSSRPRQWINRVNHPPDRRRRWPPPRQALRRRRRRATRERGRRRHGGADRARPGRCRRPAAGRGRIGGGRPPSPPAARPAGSGRRRGAHRGRPRLHRRSRGSSIGGAKTFEAGTLLDGLTAMMLFTVRLISMLVHWYSVAYLHGDRRFTHYYAFLSLFTASMLFYVMSSNTLQMLVGWELVGLCSFVAHRPLVGGQGRTPTPRSRRSSPTASATSA